MFTRGHNRLLEAIETNRTAIAANRDAINTNKGFTDATRARVGDLEKGVEGIKKDVQTLKDKTGGDSVSVEDHAELKAKVRIRDGPWPNGSRHSRTNDGLKRKSWRS
jgi:hypothetical protein